MGLALCESQIVFFLEKASNVCAFLRFLARRILVGMSRLVCHYVRMNVFVCVVPGSLAMSSRYCKIPCFGFCSVLPGPVPFSAVVGFRSGICIDVPRCHKYATYA